MSTTVGPNGAARERHAFKDLTGHLAVALCEHTTPTTLLAEDDRSARLCPLCWLFFGTDLADQLGIPLGGEVMASRGRPWRQDGSMVTDMGKNFPKGGSQDDEQGDEQDSGDEGSEE